MAVAERITTGRALGREEVRRRLPAWRNDASVFADDVIWIRHPDGHIGPIDLYPEQRDFLRNASRRTPHPLGLGTPIHRIAVACRPKRNAKSIDAAILAVHSVVCFSRRDTPIVANSQDQARSVTFDYCADMFDFSPTLQGMAYYGSLPLNGSLVGERPQSTQITVPATGGRIRALACNLRTVQGRPVTGVVVIEELHAAFSEEVYGMVASQTEASTAQIIIASNAGGREGVLYRLYQAAANQGGDNERIWFEYMGDPEDIRAANRAPWITDEWLEDVQLNHPQWDVLKLHHNVWGATGQRYLSAEQIDMLFGIDYPLIAYRHDPNDRKQPPGELQTMTRDEWEDLRERMGWRAFGVGIGLDRAKPYAGREKTNVTASIKTLQGAEGRGEGAGGYHYWEIASIDCPNGSQAEIREACAAIEEILGRRVTARAYEEYQAADLAEEDNAATISPTAARQNKLFNAFHQLVREGRAHCSPQSAAKRAECEEFIVDSSRPLARFEHSAGHTDDRIYAHVYSVEAASAETVMARRMIPAPRGM